MANEAPGNPAARQPTIHIRLLGQYTITVAAAPLPPLPTEKSRLLLAYLALHPGFQPRSRLAALGWPDLPEARARRRLTQELWRINSALTAAGAAASITGEADAVTLTAANVVCDAVQLRAALTRLQTAAVAAWPSLDELTDLYRGELLPGFYDDWVLLVREQLFQSYTAGLSRLLAEHKRRGDWEVADQVVQTLRALDPYNEMWVMEAMQLAQVQQRPALGRRHYDQYVTLLQTELGSAPSPALTALAQQLVVTSVHDEKNAEATPPAAFLDPRCQPPLLGRAAERSRLLRALEQVQAGRGQICLVEGEAGVGKSHLLGALAADARWRGLAVGWGVGQEIRRSESYHPLLQALHDLLSPLRSQQLQVTLDPVWLATAADLLPMLAAALPNLPPPPPLDREPARVRMLEALTRLLLALARLTPTVVVVDDLQWADSATLDLLIYLARRVADSSLLLLLSYRREEVHTHAAIWHALAEIDRGAQPQRIELAGITAEECAALVRTLLDLPHPAPVFERRIYAQTQGNPFFVLETLRTLYQEGNLTRSADGGWQTPWDDQTLDYREAAIPPGDAHRLPVRARPDPPDSLRPTRRRDAPGSSPTSSRPARSGARSAIT